MSSVIRRLRGNFEDMSQHQDVFRQCIERVRRTIGRRNDMMREARADLAQGTDHLERLPEQLELILDEYLAEEDHPKHSIRQVSPATGVLKVELF